MSLLLAVLISYFSLFISSTYQQNSYTCQTNTTIQKPANLSEEYWYPTNYGYNPPTFTANQKCSFNIVVEKGYFGTVSISVQIPDDADFQIVDYLSMSTSYHNINGTLYFLLQPGAQLYLTLKNAPGNFGFAVRYSAMPIRFNPNFNNVTKSASDPILYGGNLGYPNVFNADTRVSVVPFLPYGGQEIMDYMRSIVVFDGPDWNSPCLGSMYSIYYSRKQCVSTGRQMTVYTLKPSSNAGATLFMAQDYSRTQDIGEYQAFYCTTFEPCVADMTATNMPAAFTTFRYSAADYLTSATLKNNSKLDVYIGGKSLDKSNLIASYDSDSVKNSLPQELMGRMRTYVLSQGTATVSIFGNGNDAKFMKGYYGRKGFIASKFYKAQEILGSQDSTDWIESDSGQFEYTVTIRAADLPYNTSLTLLIRNPKGNYKRIFNSTNLPDLNEPIEASGTFMSVDYQTYRYTTKGFYLDYELSKSSSTRGFLSVFALLCLSLLNF